MKRKFRDLDKKIFAICIVWLCVLLVAANISIETNKSIIGKTFTTKPDNVMQLPRAWYNGSVGNSASISRYYPFPLVMFTESTTYYKVGAIIDWGRYDVRIDTIDSNGALTYTVVSYTDLRGNRLTKAAKAKKKN